MNKNFNDTSIVIQYIQTVLHENYNSNIKINADYYPTFDMNYGMAHYIAKYLQYKYPLLDSKSVEEYDNISETDIRPLDKPISILNYFLASNTGDRLRYNPYYTYTKQGDYYINPVKIENPLYDKIYNKYMRVDYTAIPNADGQITDITITKPHYYAQYLISNDLPLFISFDKSIGESGNYVVDDNIVFTLKPWSKKKEICEIDDFVASYLLDRVIGPKSSAEDIYYAQKLLIQDREIMQDEKGIWCPAGAEGTYKDMTQTVINYQKSKKQYIQNGTIFVTGYFDPFTESHVLKDLGEKSYGILGL